MTASTLAAWWVPADRPDAAAVILVHGKGSCRHDPVILLPAGMLHRNGFAVLMVDIRDMGDSEVVDGRYSGGPRSTWTCWAPGTGSVPAGCRRIGSGCSENRTAPPPW